VILEFEGICEKRRITIPYVSPVLERIGKDGIMSLRPFELSGPTYRGALHVHTTCSDGSLSPEECCRRYRALGFDFVFITDHEVWNDHSQLSTPEFRVFNSVEISCRDGREDVLALGVRETRRIRDTQEAIDWINEAGGVPVLCHPHWTRMSLHRALELKAYSLIEIWIGVSERELVANNVHFWDLLLQEGKRVYGVADDDCHDIQDYGRGFVEVWADELTETAILRALKAGRFYSSSGPGIDVVRWDRGGVYVRAEEPMQIMALFGDGGYVSRKETMFGEMPTVLEYEERIGPEIHTYARIQIADGCLRLAWTQPVWF
jgi:hypothetical protein